MRRIAIAAVLLGICCYRLPESTPREQSKPAPPPPAHAVRTWSASLFTGGGYSGGGKGVVFIDSQSVKKLSPPAQTELEAAVRDARPEKWDTVYSPANDGMTDQFYYSLRFKIERADGSAGEYAVSWQDAAFGMLPRDLRRLYDALWAAHEERR